MDGSYRAVVILARKQQKYILYLSYSRNAPQSKITSTGANHLPRSAAGAVIRRVANVK